MRNLAYVLNFLFCLVFNIFVYVYLKKKHIQKNDRRGTQIAKGGGNENVLITITSIFNFRLTGFLTKLTIIFVCSFLDGLILIPFLSVILISFLLEILGLKNKTIFKVFSLAVVDTPRFEVFW